MVTLLLSAFIMGGLGSLHCVGMCGPIALALPVVDNSYTTKFTTTLLYNLGRMFTYAILGAIVGSLGASFRLLGFQQALSLTVGVVIILVLCWPGRRLQGLANNVIQNKFAKVRIALGNLLHRRNYRSVFFIGLVNGLLPCGLVYMALAGAVATASVTRSSLFMAAFGLGTLPLMWTISFFGNCINFRARAFIRKTYPWLMFVMACLLIIRGIGPSIPGLQATGAINDHPDLVEKILCLDAK